MKMENTIPNPTGKRFSLRRPAVFAPAFLLLATLSRATTVANPAIVEPVTDRIFSSAFTEALVIVGAVGYPGPLAGANVQATFGPVVVASRTTSAGAFTIGVELDQIDPSTVVELVARGTGAQARLVWASTLGPTSRVIAISGADHRIDFDVDPFVYLNPRTTVIAAAIRAANQGQPPSDALTFYRAAYSRQYSTDNLTFALAMIARGGLSLPAAAPDTLAAVTDVALAKSLYAAVDSAAAADGYQCGDQSTSSWCAVVTSLPVDSTVVPSRPLVEGEFLAASTPFDTTAYKSWAFRVSGNHVDVIGIDPGPIQSLASLQSDGSYRLTRAADAAFSSYENYPIDPGTGTQIHEHVEMVAIRIRASSGPAGQVEYAQTQEYRHTYPENPDHPGYTDPGLQGLPGISSSASIPAELAVRVPALSGRRFVLPAPFASANSDFTGAAYDVYDFANGTGTVDRYNLPFTYVQNPGSPQFSTDFNGSHADIQFINEEEPSIWRVQLHVTAGSEEAVINGLLLEVGASSTWTTSNVPGSYVSKFNGAYCAGPYGGIDELTAYPLCFPPFGFIFDGAGGVDRYSTPPEDYGSWSLGTAANAGRLLFQRSSLSERRGWQLINQQGSDSWVLENRVTGSPAAPLAFEPTPRLVRYRRP